MEFHPATLVNVLSFLVACRSAVEFQVWVEMLNTLLIYGSNVCVRVSALLMLHHILRIGKRAHESNSII